MYGIQGFHLLGILSIGIRDVIQSFSIHKEHVCVTENHLVIAIGKIGGVTRIIEFFHQIHIHAVDFLVFKQSFTGIGVLIEVFQNCATS